ncbi:MAG: hypothetical protein ACRBF0_04295 [Calditrichia bacterium]
MPKKKMVKNIQESFKTNKFLTQVVTSTIASAIVSVGTMFFFILPNQLADIEKKLDSLILVQSDSTTDFQIGSRGNRKVDIKESGDLKGVNIVQGDNNAIGSSPQELKEAIVNDEFKGMLYEAIQGQPIPKDFNITNKYITVKKFEFIPDADNETPETSGYNNYLKSMQAQVKTKQQITEEVLAEVDSGNLKGFEYTQKEIDDKISYRLNQSKQTYDRLKLAQRSLAGNMMRNSSSDMNLDEVPGKIDYAIENLTNEPYMIIYITYSCLNKQGIRIGKGSISLENIPPKATVKGIIPLEDVKLSKADLTDKVQIDGIYDAQTIMQYARRLNIR